MVSLRPEPSSLSRAASPLLCLFYSCVMPPGSSQCGVRGGMAGWGGVARLSPPSRFLSMLYLFLLGEGRAVVWASPVAVAPLLLLPSSSFFCTAFSFACAGAGGTLWQCRFFGQLLHKNCLFASLRFLLLQLFFPASRKASFALSFSLSLCKPLTPLSNPFPFSRRRGQLLLWGWVSR